MTRRNHIKRTAKKSPKPDAPAAHGDNALAQGIWGLVYLSVGLLLLMSMLFYSARQLDPSAADHVLGPWLGTRMALGLIFIFGRVTAVTFAAVVCYVGVAKLASKPLHLKWLLFIGVLSVELSLLLSIGHMPHLKSAGLSEVANIVGANAAGLAMASAFVPLFGARTFGPYFIVSLLMAMTVMIGLRIKPQTVAKFAAVWFANAGAWIKKLFADLTTSIKNSPPIAIGDGIDSALDSAIDNARVGRDSGGRDNICDDVNDNISGDVDNDNADKIGGKKSGKKSDKKSADNVADGDVVDNENADGDNDADTPPPPPSMSTAISTSSKI